MNNKLLLSTAFFPPVLYFKLLVENRGGKIEKYENYSKQSYRNRCAICGANGLQYLSVPVKKSNELKIKISDVEIDYSTEWQKNHYKSIESAYRSSPFFEFYIDDFRFVFEEKTKFLFDLNQKILNTCIRTMELDVEISCSTDFIQVIENNPLDRRFDLHPKKPINNKELRSLKPYKQVFDDKFGFLPNLSVLDLIFNLGPEAVDYLESVYNVL